MESCLWSTSLLWISKVNFLNFRSIIQLGQPLRRLPLINSIAWSIYNGQIVESSSKVIFLLKTLLNVLLIEVCVWELKEKKNQQYQIQEKKFYLRFIKVNCYLRKLADSWEMGKNLADSWDSSIPIPSTSTDIKSVRAMFIIFDSAHKPSCLFTAIIWNLLRVYSNSTTLIDNILTNKSNVDITRINIWSDICGF